MKSMKMALDRDWLMASLKAQTGGSFTLDRDKDGVRESICIETSFATKNGVMITLNRTELKDEPPEKLLGEHK